VNAAPEPGDPHQRLLLRVTGGLMLAVVLAGFFLAALESVVSRLGIEQLDAPVTRFVAPYQTAPLTSVAKVLTVLGSPGFTVAVAVLAMAVLIWRLRWLEAAVSLAVAVGGGDLSYFVLKHLVHRARPAGALVHLSTFSFPSGHVVGATALYLTLAWIVSRRGAGRPARLGAWGGALLVTAVVGVSRIVLGVHYASDVIGGFALGAFWAVGAATIWGACELSRPRRRAGRVTIDTETR
jgi:membrane-associated phospholipid phosphatase